MPAVDLRKEGEIESQGDWGNRHPEHVDIKPVSGKRTDGESPAGHDKNQSQHEICRKPASPDGLHNEQTQEQAQEQTIESEGQLTIDVYQTDDDIVIKSTIAGVKPEDLDVNINNDMVTIRGERKQDEDIDPENYYYQECYRGPSSRSVILPVEIIADKAEATMKNGILN